MREYLSSSDDTALSIVLVAALAALALIALGWFLIRRPRTRRVVTRNEWEGRKPVTLDMAGYDARETSR